MWKAFSSSWRLWSCQLSKKWKDKSHLCCSQCASHHYLSVKKASMFQRTQSHRPIYSMRYIWPSSSYLPNLLDIHLGPSPLSFSKFLLYNNVYIVTWGAKLLFVIRLLNQRTAERLKLAGIFRDHLIQPFCPEQTPNDCSELYKVWGLRIFKNIHTTTSSVQLFHQCLVAFGKPKVFLMLKWNFLYFGLGPFCHWIPLKIPVPSLLPLIIYI